MDSGATPAIIILLLLAAGITIAGCTTNPAPPSPRHAPFTLGASYLRQPYTFSSETENSVEQFHVGDPSWGINFKVTPLDDDVEDCWFTMNVTNVDTNEVEHYGYGRTFPPEREQLYPMYRTGSYQLEMRGNRVRVDLHIAKRDP
ncbi:MAG: hypothetical protein METHP_00703 [Methanoregula sp. SKADARSKE-2]|nr:MAG: hypothetical protein METHP_00703 [Methanoregula sp. SKADARSKE-2]